MPYKALSKLQFVHFILTEIFTLNKIFTLHSAQQMAGYVFIPSECKHFVAPSNN